MQEWYVHGRAYQWDNDFGVPLCGVVLTAGFAEWGGARQWHCSPQARRPQSLFVTRLETDVECHCSTRQFEQVAAEIEVEDFLR